MYPLREMNLPWANKIKLHSLQGYHGPERTLNCAYAFRYVCKMVLNICNYACVCVCTCVCVCVYHNCFSNRIIKTLPIHDSVCIFSKEESKTSVLVWDPTNPGSARIIDKTHKIIPVECVPRGVLDWLSC